MWPFGDRRVDLEKLAGPTPIDVVTKVASPNAVTSPITGLGAAFIHVEVLERLPALSESPYVTHEYDHDRFVSLGAIVFGDLVTLEVEGQSVAVDVVARRAQLRFATVRLGATAMQSVLPELVPLISRASRGGVLCHREHLVLHGDRLRLRAVVERVKGLVASGYRSEVAERLVVRDDLGPVALDEILEDPGF